MGLRFRKAGAVQRGRALRDASSMPERVLWSRLRRRQLGGWKFRRQHALGAYVADFYCADARLVVEVDGRGHEARFEHDQRRDAWMREHGLRVVRVSASDVSRDLEAVLRFILAQAEEGK